MLVAGVKIVIMRRFFSFLWLCAREAFPGNASAANDWQWVIANPWWQSIGAAVCASLGAYIAPYWRGAPAMSLESPIGGFIGGLFGFVVTWLIAFGIRFLKAPATLYWREKARADCLQKTIEEAQQSTTLIDHARSFLFLDRPEGEGWKAVIIFARSGHLTHICLDVSILLESGWSQQPLSPLRQDVDFIKGHPIPPIEIMAFDNHQPRFWRWIATGDDPRPLVTQERHQCRLAFVAEDGAKDWFNFVIESRDNGAIPLLIGEDRFAFAQKEPGK
jgi:hypothetical protein